MLIDIRYGEISLKGNNYRFFENALVRNLKANLNKQEIDYKLKREHKHMLVEFRKEDLEKVEFALTHAFGIRYYKVGERIEQDYDLLYSRVDNFFKNFKEKKTFKIVVNRSYKKYPKTSMEIAQDIASRICEKYQFLEPDLKNPEFVFNIDVNKDSFFITYRREEGLGGLPVGVSGKVISLLSGGIDSPVATYMMMRRGCTPILYSVNCQKSDSKSIIEELKEKLEEYSPDKLELIYESTDEFNKIVIELAHKRREAFNCLIFKHYLLLRAQIIANDKNALGLVTGDNLAQVASQTLENLVSQRSYVNMPIYSPLIGMDKEEIIEISKKTGFYNTSIKTKEDYFFMPKEPVIRSKKKEFEKVRDYIKDKLPK